MGERMGGGHNPSCDQDDSDTDDTDEYDDNVDDSVHFAGSSDIKFLVISTIGSGAEYQVQKLWLIFGICRLIYHTCEENQYWIC